MKIAQIAPLYESVPPKSYGGTERVVSYLTEELVQQGHDVTLFASGDSVTSARLVAACPNSLRLDPNCTDKTVHHVELVDMVFERASEFDILHFHIDYLHYPLFTRTEVHHLTTLHGRLDLPELFRLYRRFPDVPLVSISDAQRAPIAWANWRATIHHGLPLDLYKYNPHPADYLAFIGRISPEKRLDRAIEIARRAGQKIKIAAKVDSADQEYFREVIQPLLQDPGCEYLGEIEEREKNEFLSNAAGLLFPIDWPEPFGLVLIESMACGTPVIAYSRGSVPEIIEPGVSGFIVTGIDDAVSAVEQLPTLSRRCCREAFENRFTSDRMACNYLRVYDSLISGSPSPSRSDAFEKTDAEIAPASS
jgi:glycosyltransferase involved in cell wall biosynthesis